MSKSSRSNKHEQWSELKRLLMEEEVARLKRLEDKIIPPEEFAKAIGDVLADAVQSTEDKQRLSQKLYPVVEESLYRSVQKNPDSLADAIYPVMAPAIRKAINEAMKKVTESVNSSVNNGLSAKSLKWRIQALFSGQSFGEIALKYSLLYQVQELYFIHNETGLLITHLSQKTGDNPDGDMISGMLTAIRNFVADSFGVDVKESLEAIQVGELVVIIEQGPHASLACVIKGDPSSDFRKTLSLTVEKIHQEFGHDLIKFSGDTEPLQDARMIIEPCLVTQLDQENKDSSGKLRWILGIIGFALLLLIGYSSYWGVYWKGLKKSVNENSKYEAVLTNKSWHNYTLIVTKLSDPDNKDSLRLHRNPPIQEKDSVLRQMNFEDFIDFHLRKGRDTLENSFQKWLYNSRTNKLESLSLKTSSFASTLQLVKKVIKDDEYVSAVDTVREFLVFDEKENSFTVKERGIYVSGKTTSERATFLRSSLPTLSIDYTIDVSDIISITGVRDSLMLIKHKLDSVLLFFQVGSKDLVTGQEDKAKSLKSSLSKADKLCMKLDETWVLSISGSSDPSGTTEFNQKLENERSLFTVEELIPRDLKNIIVVWKSAGNSRSARIEGLLENDRQRRHVSFELKNFNEP